MNLATLRAWWAQRQGLDGSLMGSAPAAVLQRCGWARSVGGVGPYLTLFARSGVSARKIEKDLADVAIHELPAARGCTYVVPASDYACALKVGGDSSAAEMRVAAKLGVTDKEIDKLCDAVVRSLGKGPLEPDEIRESVGAAARSLGPDGVKKGLGTTLPVALGRLQSAGEIRRIPTNGRLDQQRYRYALWRPNPLAKYKRSHEEACSDLARLYFRWIGPASSAQFQSFAALGVKAAKAALEPLGLVPLDAGDDRLLLPEDRETLLSFKPPKDPRYDLVSGLDAIVLHRRDLKSHIDDKDAARKVMGDRTMTTLAGLSDLPSHAILDRGRLVGLWEFDTASQSIVWASFVPRSKPLLAAVERTERFVREDLGDARSFSLDSPKSRAPRIEALRRLS